MKSLWLATACALVLLLSHAAQSRLPPIAADNPLLTRSNGRLHFNNVAFSGERIQVFADGSRELANYADGQLHGATLSWFSNGSLRSQRYYDQGKKVGRHRGWWITGQLQFEYVFQQDLHHGPMLSWHANGQLSSAFSYHQGHEQGMQQMWDSDGNLKMRYELRNGRRHGWMGAKQCAADTLAVR